MCCRWSSDDALDTDNLLAVTGVALEYYLVVEDTLPSDLVQHPGHSAVVNVLERELKLGQSIGDCGLTPFIRVAFHALQVEMRD